MSEIIVTSASELSSLISKAVADAISPILKQVEGINTEIQEKGVELSPQQVQQHYGISFYVQSRMRAAGLPFFRKGKRKIFYKPSDIKKFLAKSGNINS